MRPADWCGYHSGGRLHGGDHAPLRGIKKNNKCGQNDIQRDFFIDRLYFRDYNEFIEEGKKMILWGGRFKSY